MPNDYWLLATLCAMTQLWVRTSAAVPYGCYLFNILLPTYTEDAGY